MDSATDQPESTINPRMVLTGPDSLRDHRVSVESEHRAVGIGALSTQMSSEMDYVWRPAPGTPFPKPKAAIIGEIGWGIPWFTDWTAPQTGEQIMLGQVRQELEDQYSHRNQNPKDPKQLKTNFRSPPVNNYSSGCSKSHGY